MAFDDVVKLILPPVENSDGSVTQPHITGPWAESRDTGDHGGVDFNYVGGQKNQLNQSHPNVYSPVSGKVVIGSDNDTSTCNKVMIIDSSGMYHDILHLDSQLVESGKDVIAGQIIGTMGDIGSPGSQHVHYQIWDSNWQKVNPMEYWADRIPEGVTGSLDPIGPIGIDFIIPPALIATIEQLFKTAIGTRSPLTLDLDGDGIETTSLADGAYFDHNGNGFAEQTGWAGADDGLLVMDRNGDGTIDSGKELFGNETILNNGSKASNGFEALKELDENKDGKIDINDAAFADLRVWQDVNSDGLSTADELHTMEELGIKSLNTSYTTTNITDPSGNIQTHAATYETTEGFILQMGNFLVEREMEVAA